MHTNYPQNRQKPGAAGRKTNRQETKAVSKKAKPKEANPKGKAGRQAKRKMPGELRKKERCH